MGIEKPTVKKHTTHMTIISSPKVNSKRKHHSMAISDHILLVYKFGRVKRQTINSRNLRGFGEKIIAKRRRKCSKQFPNVVNDTKKGYSSRKDQIVQASSSSINQEDKWKSPATVSFLNLLPNNSIMPEKVKRRHYLLAYLKLEQSI
jgi:hypothetical protein